MKTGLLRNNVRPVGTLSEKLSDMGENTGNLVFWRALERLFDPLTIPYGDTDRLKACDKVIITDLIWIRENSDFIYLERLIDKYPVRFIPISIGLQSTMYDIHFRLTDNTVRLLHKLEERAVLGVRGEYTAEILNKYGVKNIAVIGCPSMYYWKNERLKIVGDEKLGKSSCNFRSFYGKLSVPEKHFLSYCAKYKMQFIEQTKWEFTPELVNDPAYHAYVQEWLSKNTVLPTSCEEWRSALEGITFSIGGRFHGNVMALWNGIRSLFLTVDSRTKELTDFFHLPSMPMPRFHKERPLEYYFDQADYTEFNRVYPKLFASFTDFVKRNGLQLCDVKPLMFEKERADSSAVSAGKTSCGNKNLIRLKSVLREKNKFIYDFDIKGAVSEFFSERRPFTIEYECDLETVPDSVAVIPFMSLVLPVCWLTDSELEVAEADEDFAESIDEIKRGYAAMYPDLCFKGRIKIGRKIKNTVDYSLRRVLCLYSGGVDALSTLLSNFCYRPELMTLWGADIYFEQEKAWRLAQKNIKETASEFQLPCTSVKTSFRYVLDEKKLTQAFAAKVRENWWHGFEHGIALLGHTAPYAYKNNIMDVKIAASYDASERDRQTCASDPIIDEKMRFCGCKVYHDGFEKTRTDKVRQIVRFAEKNQRKLRLRVCWEQITGENCCTCEKCGRTIFAIYAVGGKPEDFGFELTPKKKAKILENIRLGNIYRNKFWDEIQRVLSERKEDFKDNELVQALLKT